MLLRVTGVLITEALSMTPFSVDCLSPDGGICTCTNKQTIFQTFWMSDLFSIQKDSAVCDWLKSTLDWRQTEKWNFL